METKELHFILIFKSVHDKDVENLLSLLKQFGFSVFDIVISGLLDDSDVTVVRFRSIRDEGERVHQILMGLRIHHTAWNGSIDSL